MPQASPPVVPRSLLTPFIVVTSLFALWGFANDITNPMVSAFKKVLELDNFQASWVQFAFYFGYFTMALPAAIFAKRYSYKKSIILGLGLYATGALLFYPAASWESYGFFLLALYILTFGLAFLETTASPYIMSLGPEATATRRLNLAQAFNPIGALGGLIVAKQFILSRLRADELGSEAYAALEPVRKAAIRTSDLAVIRDPYILLGVAVLVLLGLFLTLNMPEKSTERGRLGIRAAIHRLWRQPRYREAVVAQAFYVGAQIMCWTYIYQYAESIGIANADAVPYGIAALVIFLVGRWVGTYLLRFFPGGTLLLAFAGGAALMTLLTIFLVGVAGLYALVGISFFMSIMFPTIYGIALEGQGEDAKFGAAFLVMAIVGGALMPTLQGLILDLGGAGYSDIRLLGVPEVNFSFVLPLLCFAVVGWYGYRVAAHHPPSTPDIVPSPTPSL
ncbi:FHS family L-fucose permease-like MFS transporter [Lewinella marina]|uniref:L-fucose:H+ symporter permease n=1 Tax=Neolewinella marina TaxID=438751 RepID=A0A2G0CJR4_9BACT|nr:L-fucose:H+ symporter permease [Neolewinella marina]NJB84603.1 FHS family L-fucose permease-like MFS transporter [Neolewinella marina]PHL00220.1 L-fucose:H+ symporter permease [Neolewinella marina]